MQEPVTPTALLTADVGERVAQIGMPLEEGRAGAWRCVHLLRLGCHGELLRISRRVLPQPQDPALQADRRELLRHTALAGSARGTRANGRWPACCTAPTPPAAWP